MKDLAANDAPTDGTGATSGQPDGKSGGGDDHDRGPPKSPPDTGPMRYLNPAVTAPIDAKSRLLSMQDIDRRTAAYRETARLIDAIESDLGGSDQLSAAERQLAQHAAVLGAILTDMGAKYLKGRMIDPLQFCAISNAQRRLFETLGTKRRPRDVTPSVEQYLESMQQPPRDRD